MTDAERGPWMTNAELVDYVLPRLEALGTTPEEVSANLPGWCKAKGVRKNCRICPIARYISSLVREALGLPPDQDVGDRPRRICVGDDDFGIADIQQYDHEGFDSVLPQGCRAYIVHFDDRLIDVREEEAP